VRVSRSNTSLPYSEPISIVLYLASIELGSRCPLRRTVERKRRVGGSTTRDRACRQLLLQVLDLHSPTWESKSDISTVVVLCQHSSQAEKRACQVLCFCLGGNCTLMQGTDPLVSNVWPMIVQIWPTTGIFVAQEAAARIPVPGRCPPVQPHAGVGGEQRTTQHRPSELTTLVIFSMLAHCRLFRLPGEKHV
jgi:hypothetical protein